MINILPVRSINLFNLQFFDLGLQGWRIWAFTSIQHGHNDWLFLILILVKSSCQTHAFHRLWVLHLIYRLFESYLLIFVAMKQTFQLSWLLLTCSTFNLTPIHHIPLQIKIFQFAPDFLLIHSHNPSQCALLILFYKLFFILNIFRIEIFDIEFFLFLDVFIFI